jgi:hypothetical protein
MKHTPLKCPIPDSASNSRPAFRCQVGFPTEAGYWGIS